MVFIEHKVYKVLFSFVSQHVWKCWAGQSEPSPCGLCQHKGGDQPTGTFYVRKTTADTLYYSKMFDFY